MRDVPEGEWGLGPSSRCWLVSGPLTSKPEQRSAAGGPGTGTAPLTAVSAKFSHLFSEFGSFRCGRRSVCGRLQQVHQQNEIFSCMKDKYLGVCRNLTVLCFAPLLISTFAESASRFLGNSAAAGRTALA